MNPPYGGAFYDRGLGGAFMQSFPGAPVEPRIDEERLKRQKRIQPLWDTVMEGIPTVPISRLQQQMNDMKEEGNAIFKEKNYNMAGEYYTRALMVARMLQTHHYVEVDKLFVSALFSNRAACLIKMDLFEQAIEDCEFALSLNKENIKAYYRKALSLKASKQYKTALMVAQDGLTKASQLMKQSEAGEFHELIREIQSHLGLGMTMGVSSAGPPSMKPATSVSLNQATKVKDVDFEWLKDTLANTAKVDREPVKIMGKKKKGTKTKQVKTKQNRQPMYQESSEDSESDESDNGVETLTVSASNRFNALQPGNNITSSPSFSPSSYSPALSGDSRDSGLGWKTVRSKDPKSPPSSVSSLHPITLPPGAHLGRHNGPGLPPSYAHPPPSPTVSAPKPRRMPPPFDNKYEFLLACEKCFIKVGEGLQGYRHQIQMIHPCQQTFLLIRPIGVQGVGWMKVRPRNSKVNFTGKYRLCQQFQSAQPCRVPEMQCSFAHNIVELDLWQMDREGTFSIPNFITDQKSAGEKKPSLHSPVQPQPVGQHLTAGNFPMSPPPPQNSTSGRPPLLSRPPPSVSMPPPQVPSSSGWSSQPAVANHNQYLQSSAGNRGPMVPPGHPTQPPPVSPQHPLAPQIQHRATQRIPAHEQKIEFPWKDTCDFKIVCDKCLKPAFVPGLFEVGAVAHHCLENTLVIRYKGKPYWYKVRERKNHRAFIGTYKMCRYYASPGPQQCAKGEEHCSFAHNQFEQGLWMLEKEGNFNIQEFILQHRQGGYQGYSVEEVIRKHSGYFAFLCQECFNSKPPRISIEDENIKGFCSANRHPWEANKIMVHLAGQMITQINLRPFTHKTAYFLMCHRLQYCIRRLSNQCSFAHSMVERDVWMLERDTDLPRENIAHQSKQIFLKSIEPPVAPSASQAPSSEYSTSTAPPSAKPAQSWSQTLSDRSRSSTPQDFAAVASSTGQGAAPVSQQQQPKVADLAQSKQSSCPYRVIEVCRECWKNGNKSGPNKNGDRCSGKGMGHAWALSKQCLLVPKNIVIRPLPRRIPQGCRFIICKHVREKGKCDYSLGGYCQFAHSKEEMEVWTWMVQNSVSTLDALVQLSVKSYEQAAAQPIGRGQSVVAVGPSAGRPRQVLSTPIDLAVNAYYCQYCSLNCQSQKKWDEHCASSMHMFNVNSDREHQWNYRQPPWGVADGKYKLCIRHMHDQCPYASKPDMYNLCDDAHSREELDEWKERWEWRQMKRDMARKERVYSYMDALVEEFEAADNGITVLTEDMDGVFVSCNQELSLYKQEKSATFTWIFNVHTQGRKLDKVALLYNKDRLHFELVGPGLDPACQLATGVVFAAVGGGYQVETRFIAGMFGSFSQWVVLDFGTYPKLVQKLNVEVGTQFVQDKVKKLRQKLNFDRWTADNREIIRNDDKADTGEFSQLVLRKYKAPESADTVITQHSVGVELNRHNYFHKMHKLLQIEELTRHHIISSFNLKTSIELMNTISETAMIFARPGELFARVPLSDQLSEDTDAGKLILTSVTRALLAPLYDTQTKVYEALIVTKENFDYDGRGRDYIYLCLSPRCCQEVGLNNGDQIDIEIQFQMNRLPICQMHYALDQMDNTTTVFPDLSRYSPLRSGQHHLDASSSVLNEDQMKIVQHIVAERVGYTPPLIVYGPFGTGKTETLAQSAMVLLRHRPEARILICTQSNSAADLYITKHFDAFAQNFGNHVRVLRVYFHERRVNTVHPMVQKYCLLSQGGTTFVPPSADEIKRSKVVISTLATSLLLRNLDLVGYFTHIFIDEAGQAIESEAIMPLTLATEKTCVVIAGDHMQMSPKVYSMEAKKQRFHRSLLERLYLHYDNYQQDSPHPLTILLRNNYRTKMEILRFIAAVFYGGPEMLQSMTNQPDCEGVVPLTFYTAQGREVQDPDSTTYYNVAELEEVADRVLELYQNWPDDWGPRKADQIGVVTPYHDQVLKIRSLLRKKGMKNVTVERVMNVQGKEFRAVFISTVRTRHLVENPPKINKDIAECDGDFGDFGFLTDQKLLNTAFTRAQSLVAVIGDPVALCSIGDCNGIWRTFLKHCQKMNSIQPSSVSLETVRVQVFNLLNSPALQENIALLNTMIREGYELPAQAPGGANGDARENPDQAAVNGTSDSVKSESPVRDPNPFDTVMRGGFFEDWSLDYCIEPDEILIQLAQEAVKTTRSVEQKTGPDSTQHVIRVGNQEAKPEGPLKIECVKVMEESGHAVVTYNTRYADAVKKRNLMGADDYEKHYESDSDDSSGEGERSSIYPDYTTDRLKHFLISEPEKYKHCIMHINSSRNMYAQVVDPKSALREIKMTCRVRCGQAFDLDEVVVEVLEVENDEAPEAEKAKEPIGQVIGILKRAINPKYRMFVCMVEQGNTGLMVPLNRGIPKMFNLETRHRLHRTKKGHVCVYTFTKNREIIFHHYEPIDPSDPQAKLFIVRYLKWESRFYSPLGIVVGVLPAGNTVEAGMKIINIEYNVPKEFKEETMNEVQRQYSLGYTLPYTAYTNRLDYRDRMTITIDPEGSKDLDDALSIEQLNDGSHLLGVHITDVAWFVKKDSFIDHEGHKRGSSVYSEGEAPISMIPERLSTDLCSLLPNKDRLTLSLFLTVSNTGEVLKAQVKRCVINVKKQLTYNQAEVIIEEHEDQDPVLAASLMILHCLAQLWKGQRLGNAQHNQSFSDDIRENPEAHLLIEEIMIMANHQMAKLLLDKFPKCTPLRAQQQPNELALDVWRQKHTGNARNSIALTRPFLYPGLVCRCIGACVCIPRPPDSQVQKMQVLQTSWDDLLAAVQDEDLAEIRHLVCSPELHPQLAVAQMQLFATQERSVYVCSGDIPEEEWWHYSINMACYTHFTSPLRRYMDLVVHRLVSAMLDDQPSPYSQHDMAAMCIHCSDQAVKATRYERATYALHLSSSLRSRPLTAYPVIEDIDARSVHLRFPTIPAIGPSQGRVTISNLNPSERPGITDEQSMDLKWKQRIYDLQPVEHQRTSDRETALLDPHRFVYSMPAAAWQRVLYSVVDGSFVRIMESVAGAEELITQSGDNDVYASEVTSEMRAKALIKNHYCEYSLKMEMCAVVKVQLTARLMKGLLAPCIQLYNLTPKLNMCLSHHADPMHCFTTPTILRAAKQNFRDVEAYQNAWMPVVAMEAAHGSVLSDESAFIRDLPIRWRETATMRGDVVTGTFTLPFIWCRDRYINFSSDLGISARIAQAKEATSLILDPDLAKILGVPQVLEKRAARDLTYDFICVQYMGLEPDKFVKNENSKVHEESEEDLTWIGHCVTKQVAVNNDSFNVTMELKTSSVAFPNCLLNPSHSMKCVLEWIPKTLPDRRIEAALCDLADERTTSLAKAIALGRNPDELDSTVKRIQTSLQHQEVPHLGRANPSQAQAVQQALASSFCLIQGPPGTGKTVTGVRLTYLLVQANKRLPVEFAKSGTRPQVLYCGPSNKSVDVVAGYLINLKTSSPKIVRVYSERIERKEFPLPREPVPPKRQRRSAEQGVADHLKPVSLHHLIRQQSNMYSQEIREMDERIRSRDEAIGDQEIKEYLTTVTKAELLELAKADVILCTCSVSASPRVTMGTNIQQLIVDEAGMCTEPETLVPIVNSRAKQVILIGDHKQLQPIVMEEATKDLGLCRSLFERYKEKAHMLKMQYRMHEAIAAFPSDHFYQGHLQNGMDEQTKPSKQKFWPNGRAQPIAFCHTVGTEEMQTVATEDGGEMSRSNVEEAAHAVRIANSLVRRYYVKAQDIVVLSQYRAQCAQIDQLLTQKGERNITVSTVVQSQGSEWDYVILSTVRSMPKCEIEKRPTKGWRRRNLGFITDAHQINVAITRAKKGLIIIGNKNLLNCDPMWKKLLDHYRGHKKIIDVKDFMSPGK